jgi:transposase InsO family protein
MKKNYYLQSKFKLSKNKYERWRKTAKVLNLSKKAMQRLDWIIFYYTKANQNAKLTCRHFGIVRSQWYYWFNRFDETNLRKLEDNSKAPKKKRQKEYTPVQYERVVQIRKERIRYGKAKILVIYKNRYPEDEDITEWKVQCIIERAGIYYNAQKQAKINRKRQKAQKRKRISELKKKPKLGYLVCLDTMVRYWNGGKRYIVTAIDVYSKIAYARMYSTHSSLATQDFLLRLFYLFNGKIENIQTDNGSEFLMHFDKACKKLELERYFSRVRTPKDNPEIERFNRTVKDEFIMLGNMTKDVKVFNTRLTDWLVEYNFNRPHEHLDYYSPIQFTQKYAKVSERYSSRTTY